MTSRSLLACRTVSVCTYTFVAHFFVICDLVLDMDDVETILFDILNQFIPNGISLSCQTDSKGHILILVMSGMFLYSY